MIFFTSDIDWAPEKVIQDTLMLFQQYGVKCTFFATHASKSLDECDRNLFEIGIHPNFNPLINCLVSDTSPEKVVDDLMKIYPEAIGVRSHSMLQSTPILDVFARAGLKYESNQFLPYQQVSSYKLWNGLIRIPYNWEDDIHWLYNKSFEDPAISMDYDLLIFDFHPIHIFLNTDTAETYNSVKHFYQDPEQLEINRDLKRVGARHLLIKLLEYCRDRKEGNFTLGDYFVKKDNNKWTI